MLKFALVALAAFFCAFSVNAQQQCAPYAEVTQQLHERYGEEVIFQAVATRGYVLTITANPDTGSWSALAVTTEGVACFLDGGEAAEPRAPARDS